MADRRKHGAPPDSTFHRVLQMCYLGFSVVFLVYNYPPHSSRTMTTVAKEAGPRRPSTSRNEGWREAHTRVAGVLLWNFHARLFNTGRLLAPNIWRQNLEKKNRRV